MRYTAHTQQLNCTVGKNILLADSFFSRLRGLMFKKNMNDMDGLLITKCNSIHTFFMNFAIDLIFLDRQNKIVKIIRNVGPWRLTRFYFSASKVLEMMGGSLPLEIKEGDRLEFLCIN